MKPHWDETAARAMAASTLLVLLAACGGGESPRTGTPPVATRLTITSGNNQSGTVGQALSSPVMVSVDDQSGNPFAGATVTWTVASGGGRVDRVSSMTASDGMASAHWTLGTQATTNSLTAASGALPPVTFAATGMPGPLASVTITPLSTTVETGDFVQLGAAAADAYGNAIPSSALTWTSSDSTIARVTADGLVVALGPGDVSISAGSGQVTTSLPLTINAGITFSFGPEETVFQWTIDRCEDYDLPDVPAHVVRVSDGSLVLTAADAPNFYVSVGADFSSMHRVCAQPALVSGDNWYPETYDNQEWIHSIYREGDTIHALITNEYHDPFASNCAPGDTHPGNPCWYNSITYASSSDGGLTFTHATPPAHVVAPPWQEWDAQGFGWPYGYFFPSSVVLSPDSFYYSLFMSWDRITGGQALCLMRTQTLGDPASWRAWDGTGFNLQMTSPYTGPAPASCAAVVNPPGVVGQPTLTYNTYLGKYLLVGSTIVGGPTEYVCGAGYLTSSDLINWTQVRLMRPAYFSWFSPCVSYAGSPGVAYFSLIDHADSTVNFEKSAQTPYLYYTRWNDYGLNRDLVRVPMTITVH